MARRKIFKREEPVTSIEEVKEEVVKEEVKNEEKTQVVLSKEKICEFYGIGDAELFSVDCDLSKYNLNEQEKAVLLDWVKENKEVRADDIVFDIYTTNTEAGAIIAKYGITPKDVAEGNMEELTKEEKDIIVAYYNDLISKL